MLCSGVYNESWDDAREKIRIYPVFGVPIVALHLIFKIAITRAKKKIHAQIKNFHQNQGSNFGDFKTQLLMTVLGIFHIIMLSFFQNTSPRNLNLFPYNTLYIIVNLFMPTLSIISVACLLYRGRTELQKYAKEAIFK